MPSAIERGIYMAVHRGCICTAVAVTWVFRLHVYTVPLYLLL